MTKNLYLLTIILMLTYNLLINITDKGKDLNCSVASLTFDKPFSGIDLSLLNRVKSYKIQPCKDFKGDLTFSTTVTLDQLKAYATDYKILNELLKQLKLPVEIVPVGPVPKPQEPVVVPVVPTPSIVTPVTTPVVVQPVPTINQPQVIRTGGVESMLFPILFTIVAVFGIAVSIVAGDKN